MAAKSIRVLLIEDRQGDARLIQEMLRETPGISFKVDIADTLQGGLALLNSLTYEVILLDLSLPDSFGVNTLLDAQSAAPDTPIVVLTGLDSQTLGVQAVQAGAQDYLIKGEIASPLLTRAIQYAIERHQIQQVIRKREEEYSSLINDVFATSRVAVFILDKTFQIRWMNQAAELYFGLQQPHVLGTGKPDLLRGPFKAVLQDADDCATRILSSYDNQTYIMSLECRVLPSGERVERWLEYWSQPITKGIFAGGRIEQYLDVTARKHFEIAEQEQRRFADALQDTALALISSLDLEDVLHRILANVGSAIPHDAASVMLIDDEMHLVWHRGDDAESTPEDRFSVRHNPIRRDMLVTQEPIVLTGDAISDLSTTIIGIGGMHSYAGVPIRFGNRNIGFLNLFSMESDFFSPEAVNYMLAFAGQAAVAIHNARLYRQSQELAVLQERQRLARELHDSVTQMLFSSRVMAESALRQWDKAPAKAREMVNELHHLTAAALAEMRILLLELRPAALTQANLRDLLGQLIQPIQNRNQMQISLTIDELPPLKSEIQIAFYRLVQEALNNIVKHAEASLVNIQVINHPDRLELIIADNGRGFDPSQAPTSTSFGLKGMQERADSIVARLNITSGPGQGTQINVVWHKS